MKNLANIIIASLLSFSLGIIFMKTWSRSGAVKVNVSAAQEAKIKSVFSSGCEIGIMKHCAVDKQEDCRRYCLLFLEAHPDVLNLLLKENN